MVFKWWSFVAQTMTVNKHSNTERSKSAVCIQKNVMKHHQKNQLWSKRTTSCALNVLQQLSVKADTDTENIAKIHFWREKKNLFMRHVEKSLIFSPNLMNAKGKKQFYFTCNNCQKHFKRKDFFHTRIFFSTHNLMKKRIFSQGYKMYINISSFHGYLIQWPTGPRTNSLSDFMRM